MPLITLVCVLIVVGVLLALLNKYGNPYIEGTILLIINAVVVIAVIMFLLQVFGILGEAAKVPVPRMP